MERALLIPTAALLLMPVLTGCGTREVRISTTEMQFEPAVVEVRPGEKVKFTIQNKGSVVHEFTSDEIVFHEVEVDTDQTKSVTVKMPAKTGEYHFYCEAKGHKEAGMVGKIIVKEQK